MPCSRVLTATNIIKPNVDVGALEDENKVLGLDDVNATIQSLKEEEDEEKAEHNKEVACFSRQAKF